MNNPFFTRVHEALKQCPRLRAMRVLEDHYDPISFGNAVVVLEGENIRIRFVNDRDEVHVDVSRRIPPENWTIVQRSLRAITRKTGPLDGLLDLEEAADLLESNLEILEEGYASKNLEKTEEQLQWLDAQAKRHFMRSTEPRKKND